MTCAYYYIFEHFFDYNELRRNQLGFNCLDESQIPYPRSYGCNLGVVGRVNRFVYAVGLSVLDFDSRPAIMFTISHELIVRRDCPRG